MLDRISQLADDLKSDDGATVDDAEHGVIDLFDEVCTDADAAQFSARLDALISAYGEGGAFRVMGILSNALSAYPSDTEETREYKLRAQAGEFQL